MNRNLFKNRIVHELQGLKIDFSQRMPLTKISPSDLKIKKKKYDDFKIDLIDEIVAFQNNLKLINNINPTEPFHDYEIASFNGDRLGKVLLKNGDIYRGIYKESCNDFFDLWNSGILQVFAKHHFIPDTIITNYYTDEYKIIISHKKVEISPSLLWTYSMIRDACILASVLNDVLKHFGFKFYDGHLNNMTFQNGEPMFIDIGSIVKDKGQPTSFDKELVFSGCYRLMFLSLGNSALSRIQVFDENNNAIWFYPRTYNDKMREYRFLLRKYEHRFLVHGYFYTNHLSKLIFDKYNICPENLDLVFSNPVFSYPVGTLTDLERDTDVIFSVLKDLDISSLLLLGGTGGKPLLKFCQLSNLSRLTCTEYSYALAEDAYNLVRDNNINANVYLYHHLYPSDNNTRSLLLSDVVVVNDIVNQIITEQRYRTDSLCKSVSILTKKYAIITYYPFKPLPEKYDGTANELENKMMESFKLFFDIMNIVELGSRNDREKYAILMLGAKK